MDALLPAFIIFNAQLLVVIGVAGIAEALGRVTDPRPALQVLARCGARLLRAAVGGSRRS